MSVWVVYIIDHCIQEIVHVTDSEEKAKTLKNLLEKSNSGLVEYEKFEME